MDLFELIRKLADCDGVSGNEKDISEITADELGKYTNDVIINGRNVIASFGDPNAEKHILLDAHLDRVGMIVTYITDDGFIKVSNIGGLDTRILSAQQVIISGKENIRGVICSVPPHLSSGEKSVPDITDIYIDTGMSKETLSGYISIGDTVRFAPTVSKLLGNRITGGALDDRAGIASIIYAVSLAKEHIKNYKLTVAFTAEEEVGERGAAVTAFSQSPDIAIAVDVSFAYSQGEKKEKCGELGKGCMIGIAPSLDRELSNAFIETAEKNDIPYQLEIMGGSTGTNADRYGISGNGSKTVTLSVPLRYMHTPSEVIDLADVENTGKLIAEYLKGGEAHA